MRRIFYCFLLLLCSFAPLLAAAVLPTDVSSVIALRDSIDPKRFPDADMILLSDREEVSYTVEATDRGSDDCCYWILTEKGRDGLRTLSFHFNTFYEMVSV